MNQLKDKLTRLAERLNPVVKKMTDKLEPMMKRFGLQERIEKLNIRNFDWRRFLESITVALQKGDARFYGAIATLVLCSFFLSDLVVLLIEKKLPETKSFGRSAESRNNQSLQEDQFSEIWGRNLFSSKGLIPGEGTPEAPQAPRDSTPQPTSLPLNLVGTLILRDELKSIATIEDKSASIVYPVRTEDEIPSKIRVLKIEPRRVTFTNISSGQPEYIELPEDAAASKILLNKKPMGAQTGQIERAGNNFNVPRNEIDQAFSNLNSVLTQARAVPHYENGVPSGYKLFQVQPNGLFGKLGLKDQDIICGIDGQPVNDPSKALELLGQLKTANHVELCIKRDGRQQNFAYEIR